MEHQDIKNALLKNDKFETLSKQTSHSSNNINHLDESMKRRKYQEQNINLMMDEDQILTKYPRNKQRLQDSLKYSRKNKSSIYDPYQNPINIQLAINHGKANRVCIKMENNDLEECCPCCNLPIENKQYKLNCDPNDFQHLGTCFPLYFLFIKQCIALLAIQFFISSLPAIYMNLNGDNCQPNSNSFICLSSFLNIRQMKHRQYPNYQSILNLLNIIIQLIVIEIFKIQQHNYINKFENGRVSASNFSIMITGATTDNMSVYDIENFIEKEIPESKQDIAQIFLLYDLSIYYRLHKKYLEKIKQKIKNNLEIDKINQKLSNLDNDEEQEYLIKIQQYQQNQKQFDQEIMNIEQLKNNYQMKLQNITKIKSPSIIEKKQYTEYFNQEDIQFSGMIIVVFNHQQTQKKVAKHFKKSYLQQFILLFSCFFTKKFKDKILHQFILKNQLINLEKCEEPSDILWMNITSEKKSKKPMYISFAICYGCMIAALISIVIIKRFVNSAQSTIPQQFDLGQFGQTVISILLSLSISTIICIANTSIGIVIRYFARKENNVTQTKFFIRVANKLTNMFAINMILTTFFANIITSEINYPLNPLKQIKHFPLNLNNCINEYFFLFITGSYMAIIFSVFDIVWGFKLYKRYKIKKMFPKNEETQMEVNNTFEGHPVDMGLRYANVLKNLQFTLAVSPLLPFGVFMCIIGLSGLYWADKYLLLRRFVCQNFLTYKLSMKMMKKMHISILYFAIGNLIITLVPIHDSTDGNYQNPDLKKNTYFYITVFGFLFAFLIHFFPVKNINFAKLYQMLKKEVFKKQNITESYQDLKHILVEEYAQFHPIYKNNLGTNPRKQSYINLQNSQIIHNLGQSKYDDKQIDQQISSFVKSMNIIEQGNSNDINSENEEYDLFFQNIIKHTDKTF